MSYESLIHSQNVGTDWVMCHTHQKKQTKKDSELQVINHSQNVGKQNHESLNESRSVLPLEFVNRQAPWITRTPSESAVSHSPESTKAPNWWLAASVVLVRLFAVRISLIGGLRRRDEWLMVMQLGEIILMKCRQRLNCRLVSGRPVGRWWRGIVSEQIHYH